MDNFIGQTYQFMDMLERAAAKSQRETGDAFRSVTQADWDRLASRECAPHYHDEELEVELSKKPPVAELITHYESECAHFAAALTSGDAASLFQKYKALEKQTSELILGTHGDIKAMQAVDASYVALRRESADCADRLLPMLDVANIMRFKLIQQSGDYLQTAKEEEAWALKDPLFITHLSDAVRLPCRDDAWTEHKQLYHKILSFELPGQLNDGPKAVLLKEALRRLGLLHDHAKDEGYHVASAHGQFSLLATEDAPSVGMPVLRRMIDIMLAPLTTQQRWQKKPAAEPVYEITLQEQEYEVFALMRFHPSVSRHCRNDQIESFYQPPDGEREAFKDMSLQRQEEIKHEPRTVRVSGNTALYLLGEQLGLNIQTPQQYRPGR